MADKIATRESYGAALCELAEKYDFVVLDADLAEATKTVKFKKAYPERFFDCGEYFAGFVIGDNEASIAPTIMIIRIAIMLDVVGD